MKEEKVLVGLNSFAMETLRKYVYDTLVIFAL